MGRIDKLRIIMQSKGLDGVYLTRPESRRYFAGFTGSAGYAVITKDRNIFITDFRYEQQAAQECKGFEVIIHNASNKLFDILNGLKLERVGFEDEYITFAQHKELAQNFASELVPLENAIYDLRLYKSAEEVDNIAKAAGIADMAFKHICGYIRKGMKESEVAIELEMFMKKQGASGLSFDSIVASGIRSSLPHGVASDKIIEEGDFLTLDFGCVYNGYCSDMTRTIFVGKASEKQKEIYDIVLEAQVKALEAIKPGMTGVEVDKIARDIITNAGYGEYFGHGLGHGVGMEVHEAPRVSPAGEMKLEAGMVITDEPGIYLPDFGGVRIEDLVLVTEDGYKVLSNSTKELLEV